VNIAVCMNLARPSMTRSETIKVHITPDVLQEIQQAAQEEQRTLSSMAFVVLSDWKAAREQARAAADGR
jgi:uncharacterized protein (DUF1778 family)